jgi:cytochrome d ubiquinol oxidase subunit II
MHCLVPLLMLGLAWLFFASLNDQKDLQPFLSALGLFVVSFVGIAISFYPMMVPPSLTIWDAAAPEKSLAFTLVGAAILVPIILAYTAYAYWVFRGKMDPSEGYH